MYTGQELFDNCLDATEQENFKRDVISQKGIDGTEQTKGFNQLMQAEFKNLSRFIDWSLTWQESSQGQGYYSRLAGKKTEYTHLQFNGDWYDRKTTDFVIISEYANEYAEQEVPQDYALKCEQTEEWYPRGEMSRIKNRNGSNVGYISQRGIEDGEWTYIEEYDCYADDDNIMCVTDRHGDDVYVLSSCNDTVSSERGDMIFFNNSAANSNGYYWNEYLDDYIHEDDDDFNNCGDEVSNYNSGYHSLSRRWKTASDTTFTVGFEIEKEDGEAGLIHFQKLFNDTDWCKESDGSLDREVGYELVSPVFNLYTNDLEKQIKSSDDLMTLINADYSDNCGGHINLGSHTHNPEELFEGLSHFFPLLYSMYTNRLDKEYSKAKNKHEYYRKDKYSSFYMRDKVLEFRIFPAVKNFEQLIWRRDLIRIFVDNINKSEVDVLRMLVDSRSKLYKHMRKVYSQDQMVRKVEQYITHAKRWNNKNLPTPKINPNKDTIQDGLNNENAA